MKYFVINVFGIDEKGRRVRGGHVIKAASKEDALELRERHGISNPRFAKGELRITCYELILKGPLAKYVQRLLQRRRLGHGGNIWYEDENKTLQIER
jgi:hypothetical protein